MEQIKADLAKCGMDCTECLFAAENDCPGCPYVIASEKMFDDEECEVGICCTGKGLEHCGQCAGFPCEMLKEVSNDIDTGDGGNRILRLKELKDNEEGKKRLSRAYLLGGVCLGFLFGVAAGCIQGMVIPWTVGGILAGFGFGAVADIAKKYK